MQRSGLTAEECEALSNVADAVVIVGGQAISVQRLDLLGRHAGAVVLDVDA